MVEKMLAGSDVLLSTDYFSDRAAFDALADKVIFTGRIDEYYGARFGRLAYRSLRFESETLDIPDYQGNAVVNYTAGDVPYTRIIEHKHFVFGKQEKTVVTREYPAAWKEGDEPYYPVNDEENNALYARYAALAEQEEKTVFGGRLGLYRYLDMDKVVSEALSLSRRLLGEGA